MQLHDKYHENFLSNSFKTFLVMSYIYHSLLFIVIIFISSGTVFGPPAGKQLIVFVDGKSYQYSC